MTSISFRSAIALATITAAAFAHAGGEITVSSSQGGSICMPAPCVIQQSACMPAPCGTQQSAADAKARAAAEAKARAAAEAKAKAAAIAAFMRYSNSGDAERGRELVAITQSRDLAKAETDAATMAVVTRRLETVSAKTIVPGPAQDKYGDPMYTDWGPIPYHDSPKYDGPRYHASFEREIMPEGVTYGQDLTYYRGRYSHPGIQSPTDQSLWTGASQSYIQSGMMMHPGSMPSSVSRVITNNRW